ncbi:MAG TPA: AI-2E family transporter, partial [Candidatus Acidoferrales bacterium]|nr:AI-2E family transporter [Candidatus Acidoferrales bacterium]
VYVVIQFLEANVLVPIVMRNAIGLSPFLVAVSLLAGYTVGGPLGAIVAVPAMAAVEAVLERLQARDVPVQIDVSNEAPDDAEREAQEEHPPAAPAPKPRRRTASRAASRG